MKKLIIIQNESFYKTKQIFSVFQSLISSGGSNCSVQKLNDRMVLENDQYKIIAIPGNRHFISLDPLKEGPSAILIKDLDMQNIMIQL